MGLPVDHRAGTHLGPFLLGPIVGQGGMGVVYRATKVDTGEDVALKLMAPELSSSEEFRARFLNEAAVGPIMDHPNVVPIYESGEAGGELYISMKLIDGRDLKEVLKREGRLDPRRALKIFRQVAGALDAAHEAGMVHRDIKPQNILLATDNDDHDLAYVSDFGLVKPMSSETSASRTGQVFGSLPYMAPEQIEAMEMDGRADVYALACVLFESLTGRPPFERPNEVAVVWAHIHEEPPVVTELRKDLPGGIDGVVMQALSKHPDDRYLTCGEFVDAFEHGLARERSRVVRSMRPLVARTPRPKTEREVWGPNFFPELSRIRRVQRKISWIKVAAFGMSLVLIASIQVGRDGGLPQAVEDVAQGMSEIGRELVDYSIGPQDPQTERIIGAAGKETGPDLSGARVGRAEGRPHRGKPSQVSRGGSNDGAVTPIPLSNPSLEGTIILIWRQETSVTDLAGDVFAINADGTDEERVISSPGDDWDADLSVEWKIVFASQRGGDYDLYVSNLDGSGVTRLTTTPNVCEWDPNWSPDAGKIVYMDICWYSNSSSVQGDVIVMNPDGTGRTNLTQTPNLDDGFADWSPDGTKIVFNSGPYGGNYDIYVMNADGTGKVALTSTPEVEYAPAWSPDGTMIAFTRRVGPETADNDIFVVNADGTGERRLTENPGRDQLPQWSPDGEKILFHRRIDSFEYAYIMNADGSHQERLTEGWPSSWQPSYFKELSLSVKGATVSGQLSADYAPCSWHQRVKVQRKSSEGWRTVGKTASDNYGRFSIRVPGGPGRYRARSPFLVEEHGRLCGPALSKTKRVS